MFKIEAARLFGVLIIVFVKVVICPVGTAARCRDLSLEVFKQSTLKQHFRLFICLRVVERGTGRRLRDLGLPMFGKTGTTSGPTNAWFVGGTPEVVAGVYVGHDQPRNLGSWVQGGNTAAPIVRNFFQRTISRWSKRPAFAAPESI